MKPQAIILVAGLLCCFAIGKPINAGTPQQQTRQDDSDSTNHTDPALYRGRTFAEWRKSIESDLDPSFRLVGIKALGALGANGRQTETIKVIKPFLRSNDPSIARAAVNSIGRCSEAAPLMVELLKDVDYAHRDYVAISLAVNAKSAARDYVPILISMTQEDDERVAVAGGKALIIVGAENTEAVSAVYSTLCRFATPKKGSVNNLPAGSLQQTFENSGFSSNTKDKLCIRLMNSNNSFEKDLGSRLLTIYGSNNEQVKEVMTTEYKRQLTNGEKRFKPSFHGLADNSFILTCQIDAMSESDFTSDPPTLLLTQFVGDLRNMRKNYSRDNDRKPRGRLNPAEHPATVPFLMRIIQQLPIDQNTRVPLRFSLELLRDFGKKAKDAMPALVMFRQRLADGSGDRFPDLTGAMKEAIDAIE